jgi:predicted DNA-binding transcriptional regulator YafY
LDLSDKENQALIESRQLMRTHSEFGLQKEFETALDKISSGVQNFENEKKYLYSPSLPLDEKEQEFIDIASKAIKNSLILKMSYQSLEAQEEEVYEIDPYEILHYHNAYYLVAYSHKRNAYRTYRFSKERMKNLETTGKHFSRSEDFRVEDMIGEHTIFKGELTHFVIRVSRQGKALFLERAWGSRLSLIESKDGWDTYSFYSDEELMVRQQLFALGNRVIVLEPKRFANEYVQYLHAILKNYGKD